MQKRQTVPPLLAEGDRVAVIAPSGRVNRQRTEDGINELISWGLSVEPGKYLYSTYGIFAGDDTQRLLDLQWALDDPGIKAVFCARGGYGLSRIIDKVSFDGFKKSPKWVVGFSDITILHMYINQLAGYPSVHGEMLLNYGGQKRCDKAIQSLQDLLFRGQCSYQWGSDKLMSGEVKARLAGGNLSLLCNLLGSGIEKYLAGKVLFIEETSELLYRVDRMLMSLRIAGVFDNIKGLVVGAMSDISDTEVPFGKSIEDIIMEQVSSYDIPVAFDFPAGHVSDNRAFFLGREVLFRVDSLSSVLFWE